MASPQPFSAASSMRHSVWLWLVVGALLGTLASTFYFAPAAWLAHGMLRASEGRIILRESQGTVWHGSAVVGLGGGPGSSDAARLPGRVQWDFRPIWGGVQVTVHADCCTPQAQQLVWTAGLRGWRLQVLTGESTWPAQVLSGLGTPWNTVQLQGRLQFQTTGLTLTSSVDRLQLAGTASVTLPDMASSLSTLRPLGSYRLQLQGGAQTTLELQTIKGRLQLQGTGQWAAARWRFEGEARADAAHEAELSNLLNIMGRRDGARSVITLG